MPSMLEAFKRKYFAIAETCRDCRSLNENDDVDDQQIPPNINSEQPRKPPNEIDLLVLSSVPVFLPRLTTLERVPELLVLNNYDIDCAGDIATVKEKFQHIQELDIAQNKLEDWREVMHIIEHMPRLMFLNLSKNNLNIPMPRGCGSTFKNLNTIVLNGTYVTWQSLDILLKNAAVLEELHLSFNNYTEVLIDEVEYDYCQASSSCYSTTRTHNATIIDNNENVGNQKKDVRNHTVFCSDDSVTSISYTTSVSGHCRKISTYNYLKVLHFAGNPIENWHEISRLGRVFPSLENLVLAECPISSIQQQQHQYVTRMRPSAQSDNVKHYLPSENKVEKDHLDKTTINYCPHQNFLNLIMLNLSYSQINSWDDIDCLARFPKLRKLRVQNISLWNQLECDEDERRALLIARLPNVCVLNGGIVSDDERMQAENAFLSYYVDKPITERPKRYDELIACLGKDDIRYEDDEAINSG